MEFDFTTLNTGGGVHPFVAEQGVTDPRIISFSVAEMRLNLAPAITEGMHRCVDIGCFGYAPPEKERYDKAVVRWMHQRHNWDVEMSQCIQTTGVVTAMGMAIRALTQPGDGVIVQTPVYPPFCNSVKNNGRKLIENPLKCENGVYTMDFEDLDKKAADAKLLMLCSPHNPLGHVWTEEELRRMMELCLKHHVLVVSDEIHSDLIFHGKKHIPTATLSPEIAANVITGISGTKTFNLAGLQASTVVFPNAHMKQVFDQFWMNMDIHRNNAFSLTAMEAAFNQGEEWLDQLLPYLSANFDYVVDYCEKRIPKIKTYAPDATYLMWLDCRELGMGNEALHDFMIRKAKLGLNDGCSFGRSLNGFMRLNAACPRATLEQAMRQLEAAVNSL